MDRESVSLSQALAPQKQKRGELYFEKAKAEEDIEKKIRLLRLATKCYHYQASVTLCHYYLALGKSEKSISLAKELIQFHGIQAYMLLIEIFDRLGIQAECIYQKKDFYRELLVYAYELNRIIQYKKIPCPQHNPCYQPEHIQKALAQKEHELCFRGIFTQEEIKHLQCEYH